MQACTLSFAARTGTGSQTVTGVVDKDGNPFEGKLFFFQTGYSPLNTLASSPLAFSNAFGMNLGIDTGVVGGSAGCADIPQFGIKVGSAGRATRYSILDTGANAFFGGDIFRLAYVSAVRSGEFDIQYDTNARTGDSILCTVLGGADLAFDIGQSIVNGTVATTGEPAGIFHQLIGSGTSATKAAANGAGGAAGIAYGWDTKNGTPGAALCIAPTNNLNCRYQRTDAMSVQVETTGYTETAGRPTVTAWGPSSYTIAGATGGHPATATVFTGVTANSGSFTQKLTTGHQTFDVGIDDPKWLMLMSVGASASTSVQTDRAELVVGWTNGVSQFSYWVGEASTAQPLTGARLLSNSTLIQFATPDGPSTTFDSVASLVSMDDTGIVTLNWSVVDGSDREILWFVLGDVPPTDGTIEVIKVWDTETPGQVTLQIGTFEGGDNVASATTGVDGAGPLTLGPITLSPGTYYVTESPDTWNVSVTGTKNGSEFEINAHGEFTIDFEDEVTVTITNRDVETPLRIKQWKLYSFNMKIRKEETA